jgi:hypothetical protein
MKNQDFKIDFLGIGVSRAATTWIWECLKIHPQICIPSSKGLPFWGDEEYYSKGLKQYQSYFNECSLDQKKGQIDDNYYLSSEVASQVNKYFPDIKLIISLRNPLEALYSLYYHQKAFGHKRFKSFKEAIQSDDFIERGFYYKNIKKWLKLFPEENFLFLIYDDLEKDPVKFLKSIYNFLEVDSNFIPDIVKKRINPTPSSNSFVRAYGGLNRLMKKSFLTNNFLRLLKRLGLRKYKNKIFQSIGTFKRPKLSKEFKKINQLSFKGDIDKLEKLINRDLSIWK